MIPDVITRAPRRIRVHVPCPWAGLTDQSIPESRSYPLTRPLTRSHANSHHPNRDLTIDVHDASGACSRRHLPEPPLTLWLLLPRQAEGRRQPWRRLRSHARRRRANPSAVSFWVQIVDRLPHRERRACRAREPGKRHGVARTMRGSGRLHGLTLGGCALFPCLLSLVRVVERHPQRVSRRVDQLEEKRELAAPDLAAGEASCSVSAARCERLQIVSPHSARGWRRQPAAHLLPRVPHKAVRARDDAP